MKKIIDCWNKSDSEENEDNKNKIIFVNWILFVFVKLNPRFKQGFKFGFWND